MGRRRDILRRLLHGDTGAALELTSGAVLVHTRLAYPTFHLAGLAGR